MKCTSNYSQISSKTNYETYFRHIWGSYFDPGNRLGRRVIRSLLKQDIDTSKVFVDIGGGVGDLCLDAIGWGFEQKNVILLDLSQHTLKMAQDYALTLGTQYSLVVGDAQGLPLKSKIVDVICLREVLEHLPDDARVFKETARALKPGGVAVITIPFKEKLGKKHREIWGHIRSYTLESVLNLVDLTQFEIERIVFTGKVANYLWNYPKYVIYLIWLLLTGNLIRRLRGDFVPSYYAGHFHKRIILPIFDRLLRLDYVLSMRGTIRSGTNLVLLLRKL
jgi:ubiquinone/menaquinone biosynthesis C-methylase UbiE